jgi:hypothetical protein
MIQMPFFITVLIQVLLIIHVLKTGRSRYWIFILLFVPLLGGIAYLVVEVLPEFGSSITGQRALRGVKRAVDPGGQLRRHEAAWRQSPNADNARRYAGALLEAGQHGEAEAILDQGLSGLFRTEPNLMLLRARSRFESGDPAGAVVVLEELQETNPDFRSPEGHLLYARALEEAGDVDKALAEYRSVAAYYPGAEARFRMARALKEAGRDRESRQELEQMLTDAELAPRHFRKSQAHWLRRAKSTLREFD